MNQTNQIRNGYFEWMLNLVCSERFSEHISYRKLLNHLYDTEFTFTIPKDLNRAKDGIYLRRRFALTIGYDDLYFDEPCSVLEMMIALAIRCEESIMDDPRVGDRTGQWFWGMIATLGLNGMHDDNYDPDYVEHVVSRFLDRKYEPNGRGGLFRINNYDVDLRRVEIWVQMCWYLDNLI